MYIAAATDCFVCTYAWLISSRLVVIVNAIYVHFVVVNIANYAIQLEAVSVLV